MMGRVKFQVWSPVHERWRTAYCRQDVLALRVTQWSIAGFLVRIGEHRGRQAR